MPVPISDEEKRRIILSLRSSVPATRFLILKKLSDICENSPEIIRYIDATDEYAMSDIVSLAVFLKENDEDEVIRREAEIALEKIKGILGPKFSYEVLKCENCNSLVDAGWKFCPICKSEIAKMKFALEKCSKCGSYIKPMWLFCPSCGNKLKEITALIPRCPNCKRVIDSSWIVCPFCGEKIKK